MMVHKELKQLSGISMPKDTARELSDVMDEHLLLKPKFSGSLGFKSREDWQTAVINDQELNRALTFGPVDRLEFLLLPPGEEKRKYKHELFVTITANGKKNDIKCMGYFNDRRTSQPVPDIASWEDRSPLEGEELEKEWMKRIGKAYTNALTGLIKKIREVNAGILGGSQK